MGERLLHNDLDGVGDAGFYYPGPVARAYERDFSHRLTFIDGPTGSGKSGSSSRKCLNATLNQKPSYKDSVRRAKIVVLCPTYTIMENTVIPTFKKYWRTEGRGREWFGSKARPQEFRYRADVGDGTKVDMLLWWRAVGDLDFDEFFRGLENTFFWLPETDTIISKEIVGYLANRWGREYLDHVKSGDELSCYGAFGDSNVPFVGSYYHELGFLGYGRDETIEVGGQAVKLNDGGLRFYHQPAGYDPNTDDGWPRDAAGNILAENWQMLTRRSKRYYKEAADDMAEESMVKRLLMCKPMPQRFGLPVHEAFEPEIHVTAFKLVPDRDKRVYIGVDTGLTPAAVFYQRTLSGQWRAIHEIAPQGFQMDLQELGYAIKNVLVEVFHGAPGGAMICIDPAGQKALSQDRQIKEWQIVQRASGVPVQFPKTNAHQVRKQALDRLLKHPGDRVNGRTEPKYLVSREGCPTLIRALSGGYSYARRGEKVTPEVDKNSPFTHVAEAAQYAPLVIEGIDGLGGSQFSMKSEAERRDAKPMKIIRAGSSRR